MVVKCVGCSSLVREEVEVSKILLVTYNCRLFPYAAVISGLIRPGLGITKAAAGCPVIIENNCAVCCGKPDVKYGQGIAYTCKEHDKAWSKWLDEHPERRAHLAPKGRGRQANWIEVFREFIEDMRQAPGERVT